jgi:RHH-type transcriptional regulator, proline utilization regulon repressor / proline dehydrogenase / delta 1-pyrroline-5-carboxylate dehydrogenase
MDPSIEKQIQTVGQRLIKLAREKEADLGAARKWENALLDWCMKSESLRTRAFRFIDVFPDLISPTATLQHIKEYFPSSDDRIPAAIRRGLLLTHPRILTRGIIHRLTKNLFAKIAKLFIAASNENEVLPLFNTLQKKGCLVSIDLLGERTMSEKEADAYLGRYLTMIRELGKKKIGPHEQNISIKLSSLSPDFCAEDSALTSKRTRSRFRTLVQEAKRQKVFLHIDMEHYEFRDVTLCVIRDLLSEAEFKSGISLGVVLQAYLRDADACLSHLLSWAKKLPVPLTIRLVRGAYWDQEVMHAMKQNWPIPVFTNKEETDAMFEQLAERIMTHIPKVRFACATHNVRSMAHVIAFTQAKNISLEYFEFQLLYGMGDSIAHALTQLDFKPRIYTPIGEPVRGMAYLVRRLLENVSQASFIRFGIHEKQNAKALLAPPEAATLRKPKERKANHTKARTFNPCPPLAFFQSTPQKKMIRALEQIRLSLSQEVPIIINGAVERAHRKFHVHSPINQKILVSSTAQADAAHVHSAVHSAAHRFLMWSRLPVSKRARYLKDTADILERTRYELAALEVYEVGKPISEADADVKEAIDFLNYYSRAAFQLERDETTHNFPNEINFMRLQPRGVAAIIAPWNFPLAILTGMSAAALVTGNTVILKPAEESSLMALKLFEAYQKAGIPDGVVNFLSGAGDLMGPDLVRDPRVAIISFTGSKKVGLEIASLASEAHANPQHIKKFLIEMGGKNAAIVDETADLDQTIPAILDSAFSFAGQKCSALSRLVVVDTIYDRLISRLVAAAEAFRVGDPSHFLIKCGPVISKAAQDRILKGIAQAKHEGKVIFETDSKTLPTHGHYVPLTIAVNLPEHSELLREELFGPLLAVIRTKNFRGALAIANHSQFALTGGVFSRTPSHIECAKNEFQVGNLYINRSITGALVGQQPFGGYKLSGTGTKAGSADYLREFYVARTISENVSRHGFAPL